MLCHIILYYPVLYGLHVLRRKVSQPVANQAPARPGHTTAKPQTKKLTMQGGFLSAPYNFARSSLRVEESRRVRITLASSCARANRYTWADRWRWRQTDRLTVRQTDGLANLYYDTCLLFATCLSISTSRTPIQQRNNTRTARQLDTKK